MPVHHFGSVVVVPRYSVPRCFYRTGSDAPGRCQNADQQRLQRILRDLLGRGERYLCHSDLAANGQEQNGPLLSLAAQL